MKNKKAFLVLLALILGVFVIRTTPANSQTICSDSNEDGVISVLADGTGECATIQDAVDNAGDGAVITLGDGTYQENVEVENKTFNIIGNISSPASVIWDADFNDNGLYLDESSVDVSGITFINGYDSAGANIYVYKSALNASDCVFYNGNATTGGGGISFYSLLADSVIERSVFYENTGLNGAAIYSSYLGDDGDLIVRNSVFYNNDSGNDGGAIFAGIDAFPVLYNNTFANNVADNNGGAVYLYGDSEKLDLQNNIFYNNEANSADLDEQGGGAIYLRGYLMYGTIDYNNFWLNEEEHALINESEKAPIQLGVNNISLDPVFTDATNDDYSLSEGSNMIDVGSDLTVEEVLTDFDGNARPAENGYDIGAYEWGAEVEVVEEEPETEFDEAQTYCEENMGTYEETTNDAGGTYYICVFEDGSECEADSFLGGSCEIGESLIEEAEEETNEEDVSEADEPDYDACDVFPDVEPSEFTSEQCSAIYWVYDNSIFTGSDTTGELAASDYINRAETTKVLLEAFGFEVSEDASTYSDVADGEWYTPYIMGATREGIVAGYSDGTFAPADTVNKVEMLKIVLETAAVDLSTVDTSQVLFSDIPVDESTDWYRAYAYFAYENGLVNVTEGGEFGAGDDILRQDVILVLYRLNEAGLW